MTLEFCHGFGCRTECCSRVELCVGFRAARVIGCRGVLTQQLACYVDWTVQGSNQATEESVRWLLEVHGSMLFLELRYK